MSASPLRPRIRSQPEDFVVEELPVEEPTGRGEHLWLWIEKRLRNTEEVLDDLARGLGIEPREVGYAGRKDRRAVTRQWVSIPARVEERLATCELPQTQILRSVRHAHRLRLGELVGNRFLLRVRQIDAAQLARMAEPLATLERRGMPNRFGSQRFGRDGRNAERGAEMLRRGRLRGPRRRAMLMLSALQSAVFNRLLEARAEAYDGLLTGDIAYLHASGELLPVGDPEIFEARRLALEVSATGPIFGSKMRWPRGDVMAAEEAAMEAFDLPPLRRLDLPRSFKLFGDRRPLRVPVQELSWARLGDASSGGSQDVELRFVLPAGSYATVLLEHLLVGGYEEGEPGTATVSEEGGDLAGADEGADDAAQTR